VKLPPVIRLGNRKVADCEKIEIREKEKQDYLYRGRNIENLNGTDARRFDVII